MVRIRFKGFKMANNKFHVGDTVRVEIKSAKQLKAAEKLHLPVRNDGLIGTIRQAYLNDVDVSYFGGITYAVTDGNYWWQVPENCLVKFVEDNLKLSCAEIKQALRACVVKGDNELPACNKCPLYGVDYCRVELNEEAVKLIENLEFKVGDLNARLDKSVELRWSLGTTVYVILKKYGFWTCNRLLVATVVRCVFSSSENYITARGLYKGDEVICNLYPSGFGKVWFTEMNLARRKFAELEEKQ